MRLLSQTVQKLQGVPELAASMVQWLVQASAVAGVLCMQPWYWAVPMSRHSVQSEQGPFHTDPMHVLCSGQAQSEVHQWGHAPCSSPLATTRIYRP